jgi:hypothetical protein
MVGSGAFCFNNIETRMLGLANDCLAMYQPFAGDGI